MGKTVHVLIALAFIAILVSLLGAVDGAFAGPLPPPPPPPSPHMAFQAL